MSETKIKAFVKVVSSLNPGDFDAMMYELIGGDLLKYGFSSSGDGSSVLYTSDELASPHALDSGFREAVGTVARLLPEAAKSLKGRIRISAGLSNFLSPCEIVELAEKMPFGESAAVGIAEGDSPESMKRKIRLAAMESYRAPSFSEFEFGGKILQAFSIAGIDGTPWDFGIANHFLKSLGVPYGAHHFVDIDEMGTVHQAPGSFHYRF